MKNSHAPRGHWLALGWLLAAALLLAGCVKRDASTSTPGATDATTPPTGQAPTAPTGNYGKVPGQAVLGPEGLDAFKVHGKAERVELTKVPVEGQPFTEAWRAKIKEPSANEWDVQIQAPTATRVEQGDILLATFHFRTEWVPDESGEGQTEFVFELAKDPWTKSIQYPIRASRTWKKVYVPFRAEQSYQPGEAQMIFRLGYKPQTIDIGGVTVENFGKQLALADLPVTKITYAGMEPDALWRAAAAERIEQIRKADLEIVVQDAQKKPVPGADVQIRQVEHAFGFGTCVPAAKITSDNDPRFQKETLELFNTVTLENDLKWQPLAGDWGGGFNIQRSLQALDWLNAKDKRVRGHVLVWPGWKNLPKSLKQHEKNPAKLRAEVEAHIRDLAAKTRGKVDHWDVMNEPFDNHDLMDLLGDDVMVDWFKIAHQTDPNAKLFINDYAILSGGGGSTPHRDHYEKTIKFLLDKGAPLHGIGLQGHFGTSLTSPDDLMALLDRYAQFKKPLWVTEYDVVVDDEQLGARYTEDFYTLLFSHPGVEGVVMWGFKDDLHWKKNAPVYRGDWSLKPSGQVYKKLVSETWRTNTSAKTDAQGALKTRGFLGDYQIDVTAAGRKKTATAKLDRDGTRVLVVLD